MRCTTPMALPAKSKMLGVRRWALGVRNLAALFPITRSGMKSWGVGFSQRQTPNAQRPLGILFCLCLVLFSGTVAKAQLPARRVGGAPFRLHPQPPRRTVRAPQNAAAIEILKKMIRPAADYAGVQMTQRGQTVSEQAIEGDTKGRIRREFRSPAALAGDVMITGPNQYRYYHHHSNTVDIAFWPTQWNAHEKAVINAIRSGRVSAALVGQETIAGRPATIVLLAANGRQMKYWIDTQTGIQLQNEISGPNGLISRSWITSITVGPPANVLPKDFAQPFLMARPNPLFPTPQPQFHSMEEAAGKLPFAPLQPAVLPPGYHLTGIWLFGAGANQRNAQPSILMRFSDGISNFSLYQRPAPPKARLEPIRPGQYRRSIQRWEIPVPDGLRQILYIGHLTPEQAQALHDSLH